MGTALNGCPSGESWSTNQGTSARMRVRFRRYSLHFFECGIALLGRHGQLRVTLSSQTILARRFRRSTATTQFLMEKLVKRRSPENSARLHVSTLRSRALIPTTKIAIRPRFSARLSCQSICDSEPFHRDVLPRLSANQQRDVQRWSVSSHGEIGTHIC